MHKEINTIIKLFIVILACNISINVSHASLPIKYSLTAGILGINDNGKFYVITKTNNIPLITKNTNNNYYFGVIVESKETAEFLCQSIIKVPLSEVLSINNDKLINKLKNVEHINAKSSHDANKTTKITSSATQCKNRFVVVTQFNVGDSIGNYTYEIYLDNELFRAVHFNVYEEN